MGGEGRSNTIWVVVVLLALAPPPPSGAASNPIPLGTLSVLNYYGNITAERNLVDELGAANGWAVTHVTSAAFRTLSESTLRSYDVLLTVSGAAGDRPCGSNQWGGPIDFSGLLENPNVGAAARDGRQVITTLDPDWHGAFVHTGEMPVARRLLANAIGWAGNGSAFGYVAFVDGSFCSMWWTSSGSFLQPVLSGATVTYAQLTEAKITDPSHPVNQGLPPTLSYCCHHASIHGTLPGFTYIMADPSSGNGMAAVREDTPPSNRAPIIASFSASSAVEGDLVTLSATASDPDGDPLAYAFDLDGDGVFDVNGTSSTATRVFGDDFFGTAKVRVSDGNVAVDATTPVTVRNVPPRLLGTIAANVPASLTLRVAGEKWHDVRMDLLENGAVVGTARVVRAPGSPDRQSATISGVIDLLGDFSAVLYYTPVEDPVNGQRNGANPAWVIVSFADGSTAMLHHTFNVRHPATWAWTVDDFAPLLIGHAVSFAAAARDVGSDDLTFSWSFGDGTAGMQTTLYNNGVSPDPYNSADVNPITATDSAAHAFVSPGRYQVVLTVTDDDGGSVQSIFVVNVG